MPHAPDHPRSDPIVPLLTVAAELSVHPSTIRRYAEAGKLRLLRIGPRKVGARRSEVERFKEANGSPYGAADRGNPNPEQGDLQ